MGLLGWMIVCNGKIENFLSLHWRSPLQNPQPSPSSQSWLLQQTKIAKYFTQVSSFQYLVLGATDLPTHLQPQPKGPLCPYRPLGKFECSLCAYFQLLQVNFINLKFELRIDSHPVASFSGYGCRKRLGRQAGFKRQC